MDLVLRRTGCRMLMVLILSPHVGPRITSYTGVSNGCMRRELLSDCVLPTDLYY